ncbi:hypothetical protein Tco_1428643 [Tanacetum coccineum]
MVDQTRATRGVRMTTSEYRGSWSRIKTSGRANDVMSYFQLEDEGATTASEGVEAEPHSYFQLRLGGATSEGAEADQTILIFEAHLPSPSGPR